MESGDFSITAMEMGFGREAAGTPPEKQVLSRIGGI
jgi:hypothetical protein